MLDLLRTVVERGAARVADEDLVALEGTIRSVDCPCGAPLSGPIDWEDQSVVCGEGSRVSLGYVLNVLDPPPLPPPPPPEPEPEPVLLPAPEMAAESLPEPEPPGPEPEAAEPVSELPPVDEGGESCSSP